MWYNLASPWRISVCQFTSVSQWADMVWDQLFCAQGASWASQKPLSPFWSPCWFYRTHKSSGLTWAPCSCDTSRHLCSRSGEELGAKPQMLDIVLAEQMPFKVFKQHGLDFQKLAVKRSELGKACNTRTSMNSSEPTALFWKAFTNGKWLSGHAIWAKLCMTNAIHA